MLRLPGWVVAVLIVALLAANSSADVAPPAGPHGVRPPNGSGGVAPHPAGKKIPGLPSSMGAMGDSISAAVGACMPKGLYLSCKVRSWSTGTAPGMNSHYQRILAHNPAIAGRAFNVAELGAHAADLREQAEKLVRRKVDYVTIQIGANDACAPDTESMTSVEDFRRAIDDALATLYDGLPNARVLIVSIPDVERLWEVGHRKPFTRAVWRFGECPSLLDRPTSTAKADKDRRRRVGDRVKRYNKELAEACAEYDGHCRWDGGKVHRTRFTFDMVHQLEGFHPSTAGQRRLAAVTYPGRFDW